MNKTFKIATIALVATLSLTACSSNGGSDKAGSTDDNASASTITLEPEVEAKKDQADVAPGEAIVPGAIESTEVQSLAGDCETAITPARELAKKYPSGLLVPAEDQTINTVLAAARENCSDQDFANWYYDEFVGWQNAKP